MSPHAPREDCYRCGKPQTMCLCGAVVPVANRTGVQILQHAQERRHPLGTTRLLKLGLAAVDVHVLFPRHADGACAPVTLPPGSGLLYPSPDAVDLSSLAEPPPHLVVIDGTWAQAHRLYRDNAWIRALPHYRIHPVEPSRYRLRKEPRLECLSTLEAVVEAVRLLEPELPGLDGLIAAFTRMIDDQIRATAESARPGRAAPRPRVRVPRPAFDHPERVIVAHVEPIHVARDRDDPEHILHLTAAALATGEVFDVIVQHDVPPDAFHRAKLGLPEADFAAAVPLAEALTAFARFCGEAPILASWGACTHGTLRALDLPGAQHVQLRARWADRAHTKVPPAEVLLAELGVVPPTLPVRGRSGEHLARALAIARQLCEAPA